MSCQLYLWLFAFRTSNFYLVRLFANLYVLKHFLFPFFLIVVVLSSVFSASGQNKIIDPSVYDSWKSITEPRLSATGALLTYTIKPDKGDGTLFIQNLMNNTKDSIFKGYDCRITEDGLFAVFKIHPGYDTLHKAELKVKKSDLWPKDSLAVYSSDKDSVFKFGSIKNYKLSEQGSTLAYLSVDDKHTSGYLSKRQIKQEAKQKKKKGAIKYGGNRLNILSLTSMKTVQFLHVTDYLVSKSGKYVAFIQQEKHKKDSLRLSVFQLEQNKTLRSEKQVLEFAGLGFTGKTEQLVGLFATDTATNKRWSLFRFKELNTANALNIEQAIVVDTAQVFEGNQVLSSHFSPYVSNNDDDLFFGVCDVPEKPIKDTLLEREKVKLDLWSWKDDRIQPQQLVELKRDQNQSNLAVYHIKDQKFVVLGSDSLSIQHTSKHNQHFLLASSDESTRYKNWELPNKTNYYLIQVSDGKLIPEYQNQTAPVSLSPDANYLCFWNNASQSFYIRNRNTEIETCVSCGFEGNLLEDLNGMIYEAQPLGLVGWGNREQYLFVQAEKDLLMFDLKTMKQHNFTSTLQQSELDTNYSYVLRNLNADSSSFYPENVVLVQTNTQTRAERVYLIKGSFDAPRFELLSSSDHRYGTFIKAKKTDRFVFTRSSVTDFPNLFTKSAVGIQQLTDANPQQVDYNWASVEVVKWKSYAGLNLEGLLYKPQNFSTASNYPLLVYYYELNSENLHQHYAPRPTASIIYPTEYASAGYLVFIPDVRYSAGHPANGAYDCIMSGVDAVVEKYPNVDQKRMGLQGQSWGGYQTAQLITMTTRFACAMAGAPVSNMFSAYGGIRWGSGYSRQFQYEHSQSRIGKTIWQAPELYVENSPLFGLPKVNTPLLIMHNDGDGAVPWYQGIEMYMGLRRLQKPVWMLNYNDDEHNLMKAPNRMDLSIRMRQFFDYYLLNKAEPLWMSEGIPALQKGKQMKYELNE